MSKSAASCEFGHPHYFHPTSHLSFRRCWSPSSSYCRINLRRSQYWFDSVWTIVRCSAILCSFGSFLHDQFPYVTPHYICLVLHGQRIQNFGAPSRTTTSTWLSMQPSVPILFCAYLFANASANMSCTLCPHIFHLRNYQSHLCHLSYWTASVIRAGHSICVDFCPWRLASTSLARYFSLPLAPPQVRAVYNFVKSVSVHVAFSIIMTSDRRHSPATAEDPALNSCVPFWTVPCHLHLDSPNCHWYSGKQTKKKKQKKGRNAKITLPAVACVVLPPLPNGAPLLSHTVRRFWINFVPPEDSHSPPTLIICVTCIRLPKGD